LGYLISPGRITEARNQEDLADMPQPCRLGIGWKAAKVEMWKNRRYAPKVAVHREMTSTRGKRTSDKRKHLGFGKSRLLGLKCGTGRLNPGQS
jgi:hypothetical protein